MAHLKNKTIREFNEKDLADRLKQVRSELFKLRIEARKGTESFDWTPPRGSAGKYVCESWTKTIPYNNRAILNCTFREVFEP